MTFNLFDIQSEVDFELIALRSILPDYNLAYNLNSLLDIKLIRCDNDLDVMIKGNVVNFASYKYIDEDNQKDIFLLKNDVLIKFVEKDMTLFGEMNKEKKIFLLSELSEFNFIIKTFGNDSNVLLEKIKTIKNIQVIKKIDVFSVKSIHHLIF